VIADVTFIGAVLAGLISFLSPCVLPLIPPYLCFIGGLSFDQLTQSSATTEARNRIVISSLAFVMGFTTVFVTLGATASFVGQFISAQSGWLSSVAGIIIIVVGLHFLGLLRIPLLYRSATLSTGGGQPSGLIGAYIVGLAFGFGWTPCIGPVLATILFVAGSKDSVGEGAFLLMLYSLGMGIPFLLCAFFAGSMMGFLNRIKKHLGMIEKIMGAFLVFTGIAFLFGWMTELSFWLLETFPFFAEIG
jgi:cytochrome c-type biogenesis protein